MFSIYSISIYPLIIYCLLSGSSGGVPRPDGICSDAQTTSDDSFQCGGALTRNSLWKGELHTSSPEGKLTWAAFVTSFFWSWPRSCDHRWGLWQRWTSKLAFRPSSLFTITNWHNTLITADKAPIHLSISRSSLLSLVIRISRYLNFSLRGRDSYLTWREHSTFFHGLRFGWTDSHPGSLHTAVNRSSACWRLQRCNPEVSKYTLRPCPWKSQTGSMTKGRPDGVQHAL